MANLQKEQKKVIDFISKFGCADIRQVYNMLGDLDRTDAKMVVSSLIKKNTLEIVREKYLILKGSGKKIDMDIINCIWVMSHLTHNPLEMQNALLAQHPSKLFFVADEMNSFELIPVTETKISNLQTAEVKYNAVKNRDGKHWFMFVITDLNLIDIIKEYQLNFPFAVAILKYPEDGSRPNITIKKKSKPTITVTEN